MKKNNLIIKKNAIKEIKDLLNLDNYTKILILTDKNIAVNWLDYLIKNLKKNNNIYSYIIDPGEKNKSLKTVEKVSAFLLKNLFDRNSLIINLGGGVITDLGGFVASIFKRGICYINIPTSLIAMVDASIGGKTGINFQNVKNILGTFKNPIANIIDINFLNTLNKRDFISGFGEIVKYGIIKNKKIYEILEKEKNILKENILLKLITLSVQTKLDIINKDPFEKNLRKILNFGHTIGHALESFSLKSKYPLLHGEAIALGIIAESKIAQLMNLLKETDLLLIEKIIKKVGLPTKITNFKISLKNIYQLIIHDKKNYKHQINMILPKNIGKVIIKKNISQDLIFKSLNYLWEN